MDYFKFMYTIGYLQQQHTIMLTFRSHSTHTTLIHITDKLHSQLHAKVTFSYIPTQMNICTDKSYNIYVSPKFGNIISTSVSH